MKKLFLVCLLGLPSIASAADFGIAGSIGHTSALRFTIKTEGFLFEPYISYNKYDHQGHYSNKSSGLGLGIWKLQPLSEKTYAQYGAKIGYLQADTSNTNKSDGYELAPNFGLFYQITEKFDVGLETELNYAKLEYKDTSETYTRTDIKTSATARLYF